MAPPKKRPRGLENWEPAGRYHFADFGSGTAERIRELARKHPQKRFLAVDPLMLERTERVGNLDLVKANANDVLRLLFDDSIRIANADYFLSDIPRKQAMAFLRLLKPKLGPIGRLYVSHRNTNYIRDLVAGRGFILSESKSVEQLGLPMTPAAKIDLSINKYAPMRFVARPKK